MSKDDFREQMEMAKEMVAMVRDMAKWSRREYTILLLGLFCGLGIAGFILWVIQWFQLMVILGVF